MPFKKYIESLDQDTTIDVLSLKKKWVAGLEITTFLVS